jgi:hypothetical protein
VVVGFGVCVAAAIALGMTLLFAADAVDLAGGCGSVDPTDPANYSQVTIVNDTGHNVVLDDCVGDYCQTRPLSATLAPGSGYRTDAACGVSGTDMTSWRVTGPQGRLEGYIAVDSPKSRSDLRYYVSQASSNRHTPTPASQP